MSLIRLLFFSLLTLASAIGGENSRWDVRVWQLNQGLPNNSIVGMAESSDGYLWVATRGGFARFDGVSFEKSPSYDFASRSAFAPRALVESRTGGLWLATDSPAIFHFNSNKTCIFSEHLLRNAVDSLTETTDGAIWISYLNGVVIRLQNGKTERFGASDGLPGGNSPSIAEDAKRQIWFAVSGNAGVYRDNRFQVLIHPGGTQTKLCRANGGGVWICSDDTLFYYDQGGELRKAGIIPSEGQSIHPTVILEDRSGAVWIGTNASGLYRYENSVFERIATSDRTIKKLVEGSHGKIWVGTAAGGLNCVNLRAIRLEREESGLPRDSVIESISEDASGGLWIASDGHLFSRIKERWEPALDGAHALKGNTTCVAADSLGGIWIGTRESGLFYSWNGNLAAFPDPAGAKPPRITAIFVANSGEVWVGREMPFSVQCLRAGIFRSFDLPKGTGGVRAFAEGPDGEVWVAAGRVGGHAIFRIKNDQITDATDQPFAPEKPVRCLAKTGDGSVWFGCSGNSLVRWKDGRFTRITSKHGLANVVISQIVPDGRGWIWFGSDGGLFRVRESELNAVGDGVEKVTSVQHSQGELANLQGSRGPCPAALRSRDGRLWISMRSGLAVVDPSNLRDESEAPPVILKRVTVDNDTVAVYCGIVPEKNVMDLSASSGVLRLSPTHRRLEFYFAELSLGLNENVRYQYRLDGYDENWSEPGTIRSASYSRLPAGSYRFRVRACNGEGIWNEQGTSLAFMVDPFLWQMWWFRLLGVTGFTGAVIASARYASLRRMRASLQTLKQEAALHKERTRIARDLHDEFGTRLTELGLMAALEARGHQDAACDRNRVFDLADGIRSLERDLDAIVWAVNPRNDSLEALLGFICRFSTDLFGRASIGCRLNLPEEVPNILLNPELRHDLFLVVREAMTNVVKHSGASVAKIKVTLEGDVLAFCLQDNGRGLSPAESETSERNGLRNMHGRIEEAGGEITIQALEGEGTIVEFRIRVSPPKPPIS